MYSYIDIHNHSLPSVDDGAMNMKETIEMLEIAYNNGIREIILTPHVKNKYGSYKKDYLLMKIAEVQEVVRSNNLDIKLHIGCELFYSSKVISLLNNGEACTLANSQYILIEFYEDDTYQRIRNAIFEMITNGYIPIIAHAEKYLYLKDINSIRALTELGARIQVNANSVIGEKGLCKKLYLTKLLQQKLVHYIATDAHDIYKRAPRIDKCVKYVMRKYGIEYKNEIFILNPKKIINNTE